jgi:hypothetical protein
MAWIRDLGDTRELVVASDSRLSGGQFWDANPKIMMLPRSDCVISFAGSTSDAYPLMLQAYNAILNFEKLRTRATDLGHLRGYLVRVFNHSREFISHFPVGQSQPDPPEAVFMLAGYSWRSKVFRIWTLHYDASIRRFTFRPAKPWQGQAGEQSKMIAFVGDDEPVQQAKSLLLERLRATGRLQQGGLNMEPFDVLRDIIRSTRFPSVGGAPQIVKIYEHMNATPLGVHWPSKASGQVSLLGRPLMRYERVSSGVLDPDDSTSPAVRAA